MSSEIKQVPLWVHAGDEVECNTVDLVESRPLPKLATNRQQSPVADTVNFVADTNLRPTLLPVLATNRQ